MFLRAGVTVFRSTAPWLTATSWRTTLSARPSIIRSRLPEAQHASGGHLQYRPRRRECGHRRESDARRGFELQGVRLDSGDLAELSLKARAILDRNGLKDTSIFASGNLNEYKIHDLIAKNAPIDVFGVGTDMVVSGDAPSLDLAYKLNEYDGIPRIKTSEGKLTLPGKKQVFRAIDADGRFYADLIGLADEIASLVAHQFDSVPARSRSAPVAAIQRRASPHAAPQAHRIARAISQHTRAARPALQGTQAARGVSGALYVCPQCDVE